MPTFGSLFAGIGGIDLGLERAGWTGRWQVEWDPFCQHVLAHHWPDVPRYGDITRVDWATVEPVDLIAGGFPCQPVSSAGRQRAQDDPRWLWPEFARSVGALRPRYVLVENVRNLLRVNGGTAFGEVIGDLADLGYDAEWHVISAASVGAPHKRDRLWIVAHANSRGRGQEWRPGDGGAQDVADTDQPRLQGLAGDVVRGPGGAGSNGPVATVGLLAGPGAARWWESEPDVGRVAHGVPARVDRLRSLGNAVVPQVVEVIGRCLMDRA